MNNYSTIDGLSSSEARKKKKNKIPKVKESSLFSIINRNVFTLFNLINVILAVMLLSVGSYQNMLFIFVVINNLLIGTIQEFRAKHMYNKLCLLYKQKISVIRDEQEVLLDIDELVLDDVVILHRGDTVPADCTIIKGTTAVDESLLTGESAAVIKFCGDELMSGSIINEGLIYAKLIRVGSDSYSAKLQVNARKYKQGHSELMSVMKRIIRWVSYAIVPIGIALYYKQIHVLGLSIDYAVPKTVAAMLGMIPSGLVLLTSIALAVSVIRLGKKKVLVNELFGIEMLARVDTLCLDKTGTITTGKLFLNEILPMNLTINECRKELQIYLDNMSEQSTSLDAIRNYFEVEKKLDTVTYDAAVNSKTRIKETTVEINKKTFNDVPDYKIIPFSSFRKWSATTINGISYILGAPDFISTDENILSQNTKLADKGERVLLLAKTDVAITSDTQIKNICKEYICLISLTDSIRDSAPKTLQFFRKQNVDLKIISGDYPQTVARAAENAGVLITDSLVDTSKFESVEDLQNECDKVIFGRVSPENKRNLILALKAEKHIVAMTGDGVNDIPAMKTADCSIAIGGGSEALQRMAHFTLLDGNFAVMPEIVAEGRRVINNITRTSSLFLIKTIFSSILSALLLILPFEYPFQPIQLTLVSMLTIGIPSFFLTFRPNTERINGKFFKTIMSNALPGSICVVIIAIFCMLMQNVLVISNNELSTLITILTGISGMYALYVICLPLNFFRIIMILVLSFIFVLCIFFLPGLFMLVPLSLNSIFLLIIISFLIPLLQNILKLFLLRINN